MVGSKGVWGPRVWEDPSERWLKRVKVKKAVVYPQGMGSPKKVGSPSMLEAQSGWDTE